MLPFSMLTLKKQKVGSYVLPEVTAVPVDWSNFVDTIKKLYPGCEGANCYCQADIEYLVQEFKAKSMHTLEELGEYQRKFLKITRTLINNCKLSELDWDALFLTGPPVDIETQVRQQLLITKTAHHPSDPYPINDIIDAMKFLLTGSTLCPLAAATVAAPYTILPYFPTWAAPPATTMTPQTTIQTAPPVIKQEQVCKYVIHRAPRLRFLC